MRKFTAPAALLFFLIAATAVFAAQAKPAAVTSTPAAAVSAPYLSAELENINNPAVPKAPDLLGTTVRLLVSLVVVIIVIYLAMHALRYFYVRASTPLRSEGVLKILAKEYIDTKTAVFFLETADRILIVGSTGTSLNTLSEITDPAVIEKVRNQADEYVSKYRLKTETKFADELKASYVKQGKKLVDAGNEAVKNIMDKFRKKQ